MQSLGTLFITFTMCTTEFVPPCGRVHIRTRLRGVRIVMISLLSTTSWNWSYTVSWFSVWMCWNGAGPPWSRTKESIREDVLLDQFLGNCGPDEYSIWAGQVSRCSTMSIRAWHVLSVLEWRQTSNNELTDSSDERAHSNGDRTEMRSLNTFLFTSGRIAHKWKDKENFG